MGYLSTVTGRIEITPPIPFRAVEHSAFLSASDVKYEIDTAVEEVDDGTLTRRHVVAIVPFTEDTFKAYHLDRHLAEAVHEVQALGSACTGALVREGEEQGDVERFRIVGGVVVAEKAHLVWPDGTPVRPS